MISKTLCLLWLAAAVIMTAVLSSTAALAKTPTPSPTPKKHLQIPPKPGSGEIAIYIVNDYNVDLNLGPLGGGHRQGIDEVSGKLTKQGRNYVGTVDASVDSIQNVSGLGGGCKPPFHYENKQKLRVTANAETGFLYNVSGYAGNPSNEYLMLEFTPVTKTSTQPASFDSRTNQLTVNCHDLIIPTPAGTDDDDRSSASPPPNFSFDRFDGIAFLPLNDTRWTTPGQGYIIRLPVSGVLTYTDTQSPGDFGLFKVNKSVWTIRVERSP